MNLFNYIFILLLSAVTAQTTCSSKINGNYGKHRCSPKYVSCYEGTITHLRCPPTQFFDHSRRICDVSKNIPSCQPDISSPDTKDMVNIHDKREKISYKYACEGRLDGIYAVDKCSYKHLSCLGGTGRILTCSNTYFFNNEVKQCEPKNVIPDCVGVKIEEKDMYHEPPMTWRKRHFSVDSEDLKKKENSPCIQVQMPANSLNDKHGFEMLKNIGKRAQQHMRDNKNRECYMKVDTQNNALFYLRTKAIKSPLPTLSTVVAFRDKRYVNNVKLITSMCIDLRNGSFYCTSEIGTNDSKLKEMKRNIIRKIGRQPKSGMEELSEKAKESRFLYKNCSQSDFDFVGEVDDYLVKLTELRDLATRHILANNSVKGCFLGLNTAEWKLEMYDYYENHSSIMNTFILYSLQEDKAIEVTIDCNRNFDQEDSISGPCNTFKRELSDSKWKEFLKLNEIEHDNFVTIALRMVKSCMKDAIHYLKTVFHLF